jgi:hypothetical protein
MTATLQSAHKNPRTRHHHHTDHHDDGDRHRRRAATQVSNAAVEGVFFKT